MIMVKGVVLLSLAACAGAASLRGEGVEEVGEQIERFFPSEDVYVRVERRVLVATTTTTTETTTASTTRSTTTVPSQDVVGNLVEFEDQNYVNAYMPVAGGEDAFDDLRPLPAICSSPALCYHHEWWNDLPGEIQNAFVVLGWDHARWDASPSQLAAGDYPAAYDRHWYAFDEPQRQAAAALGYTEESWGRRFDAPPAGGVAGGTAADCAGGESAFELTLTTDNYGAETSWRLLDNNNAELDRGPPDGSNYADQTSYTARWCLSPGTYAVRLEDARSDGICSTNVAVFGCGALATTLDGATVHDYRDDASDWSAKDFPFAVGAGADWCGRVRAEHEVPRGTCALPGGARGHRVRVTTRVDMYGEETSWELVERTEGGGDVVRMRMGPVVSANQTLSVEECLPAGRYNLKFQDMDGVCCRHGQGYFKLIVNGEELIHGGRFHQAVDHDFQLGFDWISSMSARDCEWYWAHDYRRRDWHTRCYPGQYCGKAYRRLKWSPALKADAEDYARRLLDTCDTVGILHDATDQGENMAKNRGAAGSWGALYPAENVTRRFVDNEEYWGWNRNAHLTQALWYPSRYIGCGESVKEMGPGRLCRMQVCRFAKAGNCNMGAHDADVGDNWMTPMMMDDSPCGPVCASRDGCFH